MTKTSQNTSKKVLSMNWAICVLLKNVFTTWTQRIKCYSFLRSLIFSFLSLIKEKTQLSTDSTSYITHFHSLVSFVCKTSCLHLCLHFFVLQKLSEENKHKNQSFRFVINKWRLSEVFWKTNFLMNFSKNASSFSWLF